MQAIFHLLSCVSFVLGFIVFFNLKVKNKTYFIILLLFISGLAVGIHEHVMIQDEWGYPHEDFRSYVMEVGSREDSRNPWQNALCLFLFNNHTTCPGKDDPRWQEFGFIGEKLDLRGNQSEE